MGKIIDLSTEDYYWHFLKKEEMDNFLKKAEKNWKQAVSSLNVSDYMKDYITNEKVRGRLADFMERELKIEKNSKVLDLGAGMGGLTIALARRFDVSGADVNEKTLKFIKYRAEQEKLKIKLYKINPLHKKLGFKKNSFDVVVMNGVLEWVGSYFGGFLGNKKKMHIEEKVGKVQMNVLRDVLRILKKDGKLVLAIENRCASDWFKGKTSHVDIKYADLMPRFLANIVCKIKKGKPYRTYIYSKLGYKKMLKKAGFKNIKIYEAYPTYQKPKWIKKTKNFFANSFVIFAEKAA